MSGVVPFTSMVGLVAVDVEGVPPVVQSPTLLVEAVVGSNSG